MHRLTIFLILALLITGCAVPSTSVVVQPTDIVTEPETVVATEQPIDIVTIEPVPATDTPSPATLPPIKTTDAPPTSGAPTHPLSGLVVTRGAGIELARFDETGTLQPLSQRPFSALSPDGTQIAYIEGDDVWLVPVDDSGAPVNLTNSPNIMEQATEWWKERPGWLLVAFQPADDFGFSAFYGLLKSDGSAFMPLESEDRSMSSPALGPDGSMVAYDRFGIPRLLNVDTGEKIDPGLDVPGHPVQLMGFPAWAPDGRHVAYKLYDKEGWIGSGVYDVSSSTWSLIHQYTIVGGTEPFADFAFSPDGRWLAMVNQSDPAVGGFRGPGLWILPTDGSEPILLGAGTNPVWSPDSTRLVFTSSSGGSFDQDVLQLVLAESWEPVQLDALPGGYYAQDWQ